MTCAVAAHCPPHPSLPKRRGARPPRSLPSAGVRAPLPPSGQERPVGGHVIVARACARRALTRFSTTHSNIIQNRRHAASQQRCPSPQLGPQEGGPSWRRGKTLPTSRRCYYRHSCCRRCTGKPLMGFTTAAHAASTRPGARPGSLRARQQQTTNQMQTSNCAQTPQIHNILHFGAMCQNAQTEPRDTIMCQFVKTRQ